ADLVTGVQTCALPISWRPRAAYGSVSAEAQPGQPAPTGATPADTALPPGAEGPLYVQVSTSQNEAWSGEMAQQLSRAGLAAKVRSEERRVGKEGRCRG